MKIFATFTGLAAMVLAGPVSALSCVFVTLPETYANLQESKQKYVVVHGKVDFDPSLLPVVDMDHQMDTPPSTLIPATIKGHALSRGGFKKKFESDMTLDVQCIGPWCASAIPGADYLAFLEVTKDGYELDLRMCGSNGFNSPTPEMLEEVKQCMRGRC